jgi:hypothetical protein
MKECYVEPVRQTPTLTASDPPKKTTPQPSSIDMQAVLAFSILGGIIFLCCIICIFQKQLGLDRFIQWLKYGY